MYVVSSFTSVSPDHSQQIRTTVWAECRKHAVGFLQEAGGRLGSDLKPLLAKAKDYYQTVALNLKAVSEAYPFAPKRRGRIKADDNARTATEALRRAREAEADGLDVLEELVEKIPS